MAKLKSAPRNNPSTRSDNIGREQNARAGKTAGFLDIGPKQKKMILVVALLALAFGYLVLRSCGVFDSPPKKAAASPGASESAARSETPPAGPAESSPADSLPALTWERPTEFKPFSRDPMLPIVAKAAPVVAAPASALAPTKVETQPVIRIAGIVYSQTKPSAIIDQEIVHEGEAIKGIKLVKIHRSKVVLEFQGKTWEQGPDDNNN